MLAPPTPKGPPKFEFRASRQPMLWAAGLYALGIFVGAHAWRPALWWVVGVVAFLTAAAYFAVRRSRPARLLAFASLFLAGALHIQLRNSLPRLDTSILPYADRREVTVIAHVKAEGRIQRGGVGELRQSLDLECEQIQTPDGQVTPVHSGIRLNVYSPWSDTENSGEPRAAPFAPTFHYGDRIRFATKLKPARNFRNPGAFDFEGYLADRDIAALGSAKHDEIDSLPDFAGSRLERVRSRVHRSIIARVHELWPPRSAVLIDAMVIGEEAFIDRDTRAEFQRSGTYHILVVSGMNVSILAFVVFWTLRRLRVSEVPATFRTVAACVGYAFITEVGAPVWRATLM